MALEEAPAPQEAHRIHKGMFLGGMTWHVFPVAKISRSLTNVIDDAVVCLFLGTALANRVDLGRETKLWTWASMVGSEEI